METMLVVLRVLSELRLVPSSGSLLTCDHGSDISKMTKLRKAKLHAYLQACACASVYTQTGFTISSLLSLIKKKKKHGE
jgi:hypothetical protein